MSAFRNFLESMEPGPTVQAAKDLYDASTPSQNPETQEPVQQNLTGQLDDKQINDLCCTLESIWKRTHQFAPVIREIKAAGVQYVASGSSRMVFKLNDKKVLKLAKNQKGIDQNYAEADPDLRNCYGIAEWYSLASDGIWIVSELCTKARQSDFKAKLGLSFAEYCGYVNYVAQERSSRPSWLRYPQPKKFYEYIEAENLLGGVYEYIGSWDPPIGDLLRISSYGINREGEIVLVDTGLSERVAENHYKRRR